MKRHMSRDAGGMDARAPAHQPPTLGILGIDIGGTTTRLGLFPAPDAPTYTPLARFATEPEYAAQIDCIAEFVARRVEDYRERRDADHGALAGVGVAVGAQVARDGRGVLTAPNLPDYIGKPLADDLAARLGCPVRLAHDGVCGVLAERRFGALADEDRCAYLTVSTGTGAAIQLRNGAAALTVSIQVGHQILDGNPLPCLCGQVGCLETITGGRQIARRLGRPPEEIADPAFWALLAEKLAIGLVNLAQLTRVAVVALGGGIALQRPSLRAEVQARVDARLRDARLTLRDAALGEDAPLVGAALLPGTPEASIIH